MEQDFLSIVIVSCRSHGLQESGVHGVIHQIGEPGLVPAGGEMHAIHGVFLGQDPVGVGEGRGHIQQNHLLLLGELLKDAVVDGDLVVVYIRGPVFGAERGIDRHLILEIDNGVGLGFPNVIDEGGEFVVEALVVVITQLIDAEGDVHLAVLPGLSGERVHNGIFLPVDGDELFGILLHHVKNGDALIAVEGGALNAAVKPVSYTHLIWTLDGDGELRLTIMATLAQEESRKISERVRAGQAVSRENGVLYGNGNIIGYDRVDGTYVINPEQAATIRTVFELYAQGFGQKEIVNELTRRGCKDGNGNVKWSCVKISRILRNATYMGYVCYNKSKVNNFLEKKRIKNLDEDTFVLKKGDFEPIVSEALWRRCECIRKSRIQKYQMPSGEERRRGTRIPQHLWVKKLRCRCGSGYNRFKWRVLQDGTPIYGYQCNYRTQSPAKSFVEKNHLTGQKSCDAISICEWKLDLMAKRIFEQLWGDQREAVLKACQMVESCIDVYKRQVYCSSSGMEGRRSLSSRARY